MSRDTLATLFHPFSSGLLDPPDAAERVLFLGAEPGFRLPEGFRAALHIVQGFRPAFLALERAGYEVSPAVPDGTFDAALILAGRHRGQNELRLADALQRVSPGGLIVVAGGKDDGIQSLRKRVSKMIDLDGHAPKHHGEAFWLRRPDNATLAVSALRDSNGPLLVEGRFHSAPGMFSHDRVDAGSKLLAENLPDDLAGAVADFCAGWGYLAAEALRLSPKIKSLDLFEADFD